MFNFIRFKRKDIKVGDTFLDLVDFFHYGFTVMKITGKEEILKNDKKIFIYKVFDVLKNKEYEMSQKEVDSMRLITEKFKRKILNNKDFDNLNHRKYYFCLKEGKKFIFNKGNTEASIRLVRVRDVYYKFENNKEKIFKIDYRNVKYFGMERDIRTIKGESNIISFILSIKTVKELFQNIEI